MSRDERRLHWSSGILSTALKGPTSKRRKLSLDFSSLIITITLLLSSSQFLSSLGLSIEKQTDTSNAERYCLWVRFWKISSNVFHPRGGVHEVRSIRVQLLNENKGYILVFVL